MYMYTHEGGRRVCIRPVGLSYKSIKLSICLSVCPSIWMDGRCMSLCLYGCVCSPVLDVPTPPFPLYGFRDLEGMKH